MKKRCYRCGMENELKDFKKDKRCPNGRTNQCNKCANLYVRDWNRNNSDKAKEWLKSWRQNNPEKIAKTNKQWQKSNPDKCKVSNKRSTRKRRKNLAASYIKSILYPYLKISYNQVPSEMIRLKREQLLVHRALKSLREELNERIR